MTTVVTIYLKAKNIFSRFRNEVFRAFEVYWLPLVQCLCHLSVHEPSVKVTSLDLL